MVMERSRLIWGTILEAMTAADELDIDNKRKGGIEDDVHFAYLIIINTQSTEQVFREFLLNESILLKSY